MIKYIPRSMLSFTLFDSRINPPVRSATTLNLAVLFPTSVTGIINAQETVC